MTVVFGVNAPGIAEIVRVARDRVRVAAAPEVGRRLAAARAVVERYVRDDLPAYGLTTGLGAGVDTRLAADALTAFQMRVPLGRSVGVGRSLPTVHVRAMMAARLASLAAGGSGIAPDVFDGLMSALNAGFHPVVPSLGSIGAGDLAPLAAMGAALIGVGEAEVGGTIYPASEALGVAGLTPLSLGPKDGHALVVANSLSVGQAALVIDDLERLQLWTLKAISLSFEAFRANVGALDDRGLACRPVDGQREVASAIIALLSGSALWEQGAARRLQDPLSYRCVPQIMGAASSAIAAARMVTEVELASSGDNPVVLVDDGLILSNGNFDMTAFALAFEHLGLALAHWANASAQRALKLMSPAVSGLPRFLNAHGADRNGLATLQKTLAALEAEIRHLALPLAFAPLPVADGIEDVASMAPGVVTKTADIVERLTYLTAIELIVAAQAVDLRGIAHLGAGASDVYALVRTEVPPLIDDRPLGPEIMRLARRILGTA